MYFILYIYHLSLFYVFIICFEFLFVTGLFKIILPIWPKTFIKLFSCSTQLSMKFQLLIKAKMLKNNYFSCCQTLSWCIYPGLMSRINIMVSLVEHEKSFINSGPRG